MKLANKELIIKADFPVEQKVLGLIMCIAQEKQAEIARLLKPLDLSFLQLNLLHTLDYAPLPELTVNQLKSALVEDSPNVSRALNKLVEKGLITKRRCQQDQRTVYISITESGRKMHKEGDEQLMGTELSFENSDAEQLYQLLKNL